MGHHRVSGGRINTNLFPREGSVAHVASHCISFTDFYLFILFFSSLLAGAFAYCNPQNTSGESKLDYVTAEIQVR